MTNEQQFEWLRRVVSGPGGFMDYMERECGSDMTYEMGCVEEPDQAAKILCLAAAFVIRCLANPKCEGSAEVLEDLHGRRERLRDEYIRS